MTAEERGVYREFIDELWLRNGVLPFDEMHLARVAGGETVFARVKDKVLSHFIRTEDGWRNEVHDAVQADSRKRAEKQARYRAAKRNVTGNGASNVPSSPSPSIRTNKGDAGNVTVYVEPPMPIPPGVRDDTDIDRLNAVWSQKRGGDHRYIGECLSVVRAVGLNRAVAALEAYLDAKEGEKFKGSPSDFAANYRMYAKKEPEKVVYASEILRKARLG